MKKPIALFIALILSLCLLCSCQSDDMDFPGRAKIQSVIDTAAKYGSGRYIITNLQTGIPEQIFSFMFDENDREIWLDEIADGTGEIVSYRYYDGENILYTNGDIESAVYTRTEPYNMGTGVLLFYIPTLVASGTMTVATKQSGYGADLTGCTIYEQVYDLEKLQKASGSFTDAVSFKTSYLFRGETFLAMTEHIEYADGRLDNYQIEIIDINAVTAVEKPELAAAP
jgi:hypothetical protein